MNAYTHDSTQYCVDGLRRTFFPVAPAAALFAAAISDLVRGVPSKGGAAALFAALAAWKIVSQPGSGYLSVSLRPMKFCMAGLRLVHCTTCIGQCLLPTGINLFIPGPGIPTRAGNTLGLPKCGLHADEHLLPDQRLHVGFGCLKFLQAGESV